MRPLHIHITYERYAVGKQPTRVSEAPKYRADRSLGSPSISIINFVVIAYLSNVVLNKIQKQIRTLSPQRPFCTRCLTL